MRAGLSTAALAVLTIAFTGCGGGLEDAPKDAKPVNPMEMPGMSDMQGKMKDKPRPEVTGKQPGAMPGMPPGMPGMPGAPGRR